MQTEIIKFLNDFRIFPRAQLFFWGIMVYKVGEWAMSQPDLSTGQGGFVAAVFAAGSAYGKFYNDSGQK